MTHHHHASEWHTGWIESETHPLALVSGFADLDDHLAELNPNHPLHALATYALQRQAQGWPWDDRCGFWTAVLPLWPRRKGPEPFRERIAEVAESLRLLLHLDRAEIAEVIGYAPDSIRSARYPARHRLVMSRAAVAAAAVPPPSWFQPAPLVYAADGVDPPPCYLGRVVGPALGLPPHPEVKRALERAHARAARMVADGEIEVVDGDMGDHDGFGTFGPGTFRVRDGHVDWREALSAMRERVALHQNQRPPRTILVAESRGLSATERFALAEERVSQPHWATADVVCRLGLW